MKWRRSLTLGLVVCGAIFFLILVFGPTHYSHPGPPAENEWKLPDTENEWRLPDNGTAKATLTPDYSKHPIDQLINHANQDFATVRSRQSRTEVAAVKEYRRRYGIPPPPNFDKWFSFAQGRGAQLIDEYDTIHDSLTPFWALEPVSVRERVREAIGRSPENGLIALMIRRGKAAKIEGGAEWQRDVTLKMIKDFVQYLPDMDLAFNIHDEPRVVVPHDDLSRMVQFAKDVAMPASFANKQPRNSFSSKPKDVNDGGTVQAYATTRFNEFAHQQVWIPASLSCPPYSAAKDYRDDPRDNTAPYAFGELGFVYNQTAFSDICLTPSLRTNHGFFERPNAFKVTHELVPIFSQSKMSSFNDILYPSPWYYYGKTVTDQPASTHPLQYDENLDMNWEYKETSFWWRGSTTGGYSRRGGWHNQHRQRFTQNIMGLDPAYKKIKVVENNGWGDVPDLRAKFVSRDKYAKLFDIRFTSVGQCDEEDCKAQINYFKTAPAVNSQDAWKYKYLLDIDGNAFSGRFYAFLRSHSLVFKMAVFREWHQEWLWPWVHYVPLSLKGDDYAESVRYFAEDQTGLVQGPMLAEQGREWAGKALRNEDLEVWFFRLLLEYGRVVDDARDKIGYSV